MYVALSSEVSPRIREFARNATTIMSTQIGPGLRDYLTALEDALRERKLAGPLLVMQSNGGAVAAAEAPAAAISTVGSVLTGGVVGSVQLGRQLGHRNIISTDVGGTTFLVGLVVDGEPVRATTTVINHHPINVPTLRVRRDRLRRRCDRLARRRAATCGSARAARGPYPAPPATARAAPSRPTPTPTWCSGILPETRAARRPQAAVARSSPGRPSTPRSPSRSACRSRTPPRRSTPSRTRRPATCCARPSSRPGTTRASSCSTPSAVPAPRTAPRYAAEVGVEEVVVPLGPGGLGVLRLRTGRRPTSCSPRSCPTPPSIPFDPVRAERNFAELESRVLDGLQPAGRDTSTTVELHREIDMRYTMQLAEVTTPVADGPLDSGGDRGMPPPAFEQRYAALYGADTGFREAGIQAITYRVRGVGVLPFSPSCPSVADATSRRPEPARTGSRPVCLDGAAGYVETADLRLPGAARRARPHRPRRSSRYRPRPSSSRPVPRPPSTTSAT